MNRSTRKALAVRHVLVLLLLAVGLSGCTTCKKLWDKTFRRHAMAATPESFAGMPDTGLTTTKPIVTQDVAPTPLPLERPTEPAGPIPELESVHFDYDSSALRPDARAILDKNVEWLKANATVRVQIEGHCDERGTEEYNMALGERRAQSVMDYLVKNGIDAGRIFTITYGETRPVDPGHDESAWWKNRRAEFSSLR